MICLGVRHLMKTEIYLENPKIGQENSCTSKTNYELFGTFQRANYKNIDCIKNQLHKLRCKNLFPDSCILMRLIFTLHLPMQLFTIATK